MVSGNLGRVDPLASWTPEDLTVDKTTEAFVNPNSALWDQVPDVAVSQRGQLSSLMVTRDNSPAPSPQVSDAEMDDVTS